MGNISSKKYGYQELRSSVVGSMLQDSDFDLFYSMCKVETRQISTSIYPHRLQIFYVVITGEVAVLLSSDKVRPRVATTFGPGEIIHFLGCSSVYGTGTSMEYISNEKIRLTLQYRGKKTSRIIGMDKNGMEAFFALRPHLRDLRSFLELDLYSMHTRSPQLKTLTRAQVNMLGLLMKVRLSQVGDMLDPRKQPVSGKDANVVNIPVSSIGMVLLGSCINIPIHDDNVEQLATKLKSTLTVTANTSTGLSPIKAKESHFASSMRNLLALRLSFTSSVVDRSTNNGSHTARSGNGAGVVATSTTAVPASPPSSSSLPSDATTTVSLSSTVIAALESTSCYQSSACMPIGVGSIFGMGTFFLRKPVIPLITTVATSPGIIGYFPLAALDAMSAVDARFYRVVGRNCYMIWLNMVKYSVPMLCDMDEWSYALLTCKIFLRGYETGSIIFEKGAPSDYAYIILHGSVREKSLIPASDPILAGLEMEKVLRWGQLFGEISLVTDSPYFSTTIAKEPTVVIAMSKRTLDQIYHDNKAQLSEIRIRLMGTEIGLQHILDHPIGSKLFHKHLMSELAAESLLFYRAVDKFDSLCASVSKQYASVMKQRAAELESERLRSSSSSQQHQQPSINATLTSSEIYVATSTGSTTTNAGAAANLLTETSADMAAGIAEGEEDDDVVDDALRDMCANGRRSGGNNAKNYGTRGSGFGIMMSDTSTSSMAISTTERASSFVRSFKSLCNGEEDGGVEEDDNNNNDSGGKNEEERKLKIRRKEEEEGGGGGTLDDLSQLSSSSSYNNNNSWARPSNKNGNTIITNSNSGSGRNGVYGSNGAPSDSFDTFRGHFLENNNNNSYNIARGGNTAVGGGISYKMPPLEPIASVVDLYQNMMVKEEEEEELHLISAARSGNTTARALLTQQSHSGRGGNKYRDMQDEGYSGGVSSSLSLCGGGDGNGGSRRRMSVHAQPLEITDLDALTGSCTNDNTAATTTLLDAIDGACNTPRSRKPSHDNNINNSTSGEVGRKRGGNGSSSNSNSNNSSNFSIIQPKRAGFTNNKVIPFNGNSSNNNDTTAATSFIDHKPATTVTMKADTLICSAISTDDRDDNHNPTIAATITTTTDNNNNNKNAKEAGGIALLTAGMSINTNRNNNKLNTEQKIQRIQKNIIELQEVARNIMDNFIYEGSINEVNIPGKVRVTTEKRFNEWVSKVNTSSFVKSSTNSPTSNQPNGVETGNNTNNKDNATTSTDNVFGSGGGAVGRKKSLLASSLTTTTTDPTLAAATAFAAMMSVDDANGGLFPSDYIAMDFTDLFATAKAEILKLLRDDKYPRWRTTNDFHQFINNIKPYENKSNSDMMSVGSNMMERSYVSNMYAFNSSPGGPHSSSGRGSGGRKSFSRGGGSGSPVKRAATSSGNNSTHSQMSVYQRDSHPDSVHNI